MKDGRLPVCSVLGAFFDSWYAKANCSGNGKMVSVCVRTLVVSNKELP